MGRYSGSRVMTSNEAIVVTSGSRLHGGFYYIGDEWSIRWGALGFYVELPKFEAKVFPCEEQKVRGPPEVKELVERVLNVLRAKNFCVEIYDYIPRHVGLGSTTQTSLSVACAVNLLNGKLCDSKALARSLGLAKYSGVGTLLFEKGGFVVDSGLPDPNGPRALIHSKIPEEWRFVIVIPRFRRGLSEEEEDMVMRRTWKASPNVERLMMRGTLRVALGILRNDIYEVQSGLREVQSGTGIYFSRVQGSTYRPDLASIVAEAERNGIYLAQSSWGPTLYTITTEDMASSDAFMLRSILRNLKVNGDVLIVSPRNAVQHFNIKVLRRS